VGAGSTQAYLRGGHLPGGEPAGNCDCVAWTRSWLRADGYKRVIGEALRSRTDQTEVAVAAAALNRMLAFGRPKYVRIA
jgi:hypothetical protein